MLRSFQFIIFLKLVIFIFNNLKFFIFFRNWNIWEIFGICHIANFWNFRKWKFFKLFELNVVECSKSTIFKIFKIEIFLYLPKCSFSELSKSKILSNFRNLKFFGIVQIGKLRNFEIFPIWKIKVWLQKLPILKLFVHSIFRTTRNFANSHMCPLI